MSRACSLYLVEGADATKRHAAARAVGELVNGLVFDCRFPGCGGGALYRLCLEAMAPAARGLRPVVLDGAWPGEPVRRLVAGDGSRLDLPDLRALDRVAWRCGGRVILADACSAGGSLDGVDVRGIGATPAPRSGLYGDCTQYGLCTTLPVAQYNGVGGILAAVGEPAPHGHTASPTDGWEYRAPVWSSACGNLRAPAVLVVDAPLNHDAYDALMQLPYASCRAYHRMFAQTLEDAGIPESALLWTYADENLGPLAQFVNPDAIWFALGTKAGQVTTAALAGKGRTVRVTRDPRVEDLDGKLYFGIAEAMLTAEQKKET